MVRVRAGFFSAGMVSLISRKILLLVCFSFAQPQLLCFLLRLKRTSDLVLDLNIIINLSITRLGFFRLVISSNLSFVFLFAFVLLFCVQLFRTIFTHFLSSQVVFESVQMQSRKLYFNTVSEICLRILSEMGLAHSDGFSSWWSSQSLINRVRFESGLGSNVCLRLAHSPSL